jgi:UDP-N-acetylmuramyl pentapeptide phosphotransferase/UDP-N-acetylglucosamine-1-phosphate transferase
VIVALAIAPALARGLEEGGFTRTNYRDVAVASPFGLLILATMVVGLGILGLLAALSTGDASDIANVASPGFVLGVAALGLADDVFSGSSRGLRGHGAAVLKGSFSTGALKAIGVVGLALWFALPGRVLGGSFLDYVLTVAVLVLATNLFNLLDLRPGRSVKAFLILGFALAVVAWDSTRVFGFGLYLGPIVVAGLYDLREQAMLGDTGSNAIGAVAGLWLVATLTSTVGLAVAAVILAGITAYGEFRSISALVDRTPGLRHLDSIGRIHRA